MSGRARGSRTSWTNARFLAYHRRMQGFVILVAAALIAGCGQSVPVTTPSQGAAACSPNVTTALLPDWARTGFTDPAPTMPYEDGRSGEIAAIVFGFPLQAPPS